MKTHISIATGGTGGIYYPLGGGMAELISKHIPNTEATTVAGLGALAAALTGWLLTKKTLIERISPDRRRTGAGLSESHPGCHRHRLIWLGWAITVPPAHWRGSVNREWSA